MKNQLIVNLIIVMLLVGQNMASGQKIYASPKGKDSNSGTMNEPLATLNSAINKSRLLRESRHAKDPCEIIVMPGTYFMLQTLGIRSEDSGTPYMPLVIKAEGDERPVFTGGVKIEDFEKAGENLWKAFIPQVAWYDSYFEQLYVNGRRAVRAQTPNEGFYFIKGVTETVLEKGEGRF